MLQHPRIADLVREVGHDVVRERVQSVLADARAEIDSSLAAETRAGETQPSSDAPMWWQSPEQLADRVVAAAIEATRPRLRRVINATGIVIHTNLGRAPLSARARRQLDDIARGYSNLEYELTSGTRGHRHNVVEPVLRGLTGAAAATVVNNNAAAVLLVLSALAANGEVVVSRGELIEIGGSFRIPDVMAQSGAQLIEVGTTNRTHAEDYERATSSATVAYFRAFPSNYRIIGFTESVALPDLASLAHQRGKLLIVDLGSGALVDFAANGLPAEWTPRQVLSAGADIVTFSGDKLLGGAQAGLIVGRSDLVNRCRIHPLARALRIDKLSLAALEGTLAAYLQPENAWQEIPVLRMLRASEHELKEAAEALASSLRTVVPAQWLVQVVRADSRAGGGALPEEPLTTWCVSIEGPAPDALAEQLRRAEPPIVARRADGRLLLDPRTLQDGEAAEIVNTLARITSDGMGQIYLR